MFVSKIVARQHGFVKSKQAEESRERTQISLDTGLRDPISNVIIKSFISNLKFVQYLSTLLSPAQAHKHFQFPATALYF